MIESNDRADLHDRVIRETPVRSRRRKNARWKSGLVLAGFGAVVLGAGYLAGVNAPAVNASGTAGTIEQSDAARPDANQKRFLVPQHKNSDNGQVFQLNGDDGFSGDDDGEFFGNRAAQGDHGSSQFDSRGNRQSGGLGQVRPNFGGPITRSRGS